MDLKVIADAIAARFAGVTAVGESLTSAPTASLPNTINSGPVLLVYPPSGTRSVGVSRQRQDELEYVVRLLRDPLDVPARTDALYAWANAIYDKVLENYDLDLEYVTWAEPVNIRVALDGESYAGKPFDVVEMGIRVLVREIVSTMAL